MEENAASVLRFDSEFLPLCNSVNLWSVHVNLWTCTVSLNLYNNFSGNVFVHFAVTAMFAVFTHVLIQLLEIGLHSWWLRLLAGPLGKFDLVPGRGSRFISSPKHPDHLWGSPSILFSVYQELFSPGVKQQGHEIDHSPPSSVRVRMSATTHFSPSAFTVHTRTDYCT
jgi:hypothetical protein